MGHRRYLGGYFKGFLLCAVLKYRFIFQQLLYQVVIFVACVPLLMAHGEVMYLFAEEEYSVCVFLQKVKNIVLCRFIID